MLPCATLPWQKPVLYYVDDSLREAQ